MPFRAAMAEIWAEPHARALRDLRVAVDDRLFHAGADPRAVRRPRLRLHPRPVHLDGGAAERRRLPRHARPSASRPAGCGFGSLKLWTAGGCLGSAAALAGDRARRVRRPGAPLLPLVFALGFFNGVFAVAAIGSMMQLAGDGRADREGTRMGLWGAAQAIAAGFGGLARRRGGRRDAPRHAHARRGLRRGVSRRGGAVPLRRLSRAPAGHPRGRAAEPQPIPGE